MRELTYEIKESNDKLIELSIIIEPNSSEDFMKVYNLFRTFILSLYED